MSQQEYEIHIYGLHDSDVTLKDEYKEKFVEGFFYDLMDDGTLDKYGLDYESTVNYGEGDYIGVTPYIIYPWGNKPDVSDFSSEEAVKDAIVDAIKKYVEETPEEIRKKIGYYHTNGCCWGNLTQRWKKFCRPSL